MNALTAEQLGLIYFLLGLSGSLSVLAEPYLRERVLPAVRHQQIQFAFDDSGEPLAYWTWAYLTRDSTRRILSEPNALLHLSEWNEGETLWIIDFVAPRGRLRDIILHARAFFESEHQTVFTFRQHNDGHIKKINRHELAGASSIIKSMHFTGVRVAPSRTMFDATPSIMPASAQSL